MTEMKLNLKNLNMVASGQIELLCKIKYPAMKKVKVGQVVRFCCKNNYCDVRIDGIRPYLNVYQMLKNENTQKLLPGNDFNQSLNYFQKIFPPWKVKKFKGVLVFDFTLMEKGIKTKKM